MIKKIPTKMLQLDSNKKEPKASTNSKDYLKTEPQKKGNLKIFQK